MAQTVQQWIATAAFGAALATAVAAVAPQLLAAQPAPVLEPAPVAAASEVENAAALDGAVDMNHWQETAAPNTPILPYVPGKDKKGK